MNAYCELDGDRFDVRLGYLLLGRRVRLDLAARFGEGRATAAAAAAYLGGANDDEISAYVASQQAANWSDVLDVERMSVRVEYDRLYAAPGFREVPGFRRAHLDAMDAELSLVRPPRRVARNIYRATHHAWPGAPQLFFDENELPTGVALSSTLDVAERHEALVVAGRFAYPVSTSWMLLPQRTTASHAGTVAGWLEEHWPQALELCRTENDRLPDHPLDRPSMALAAEAYSRGLPIEEAAIFIFEARAAEMELDV